MEWSRRCVQLVSHTPWQEFDLQRYQFASASGLFVFLLGVAITLLSAPLLAKYLSARAIAMDGQQPSVFFR
jgi:hypothetical protein